MLRYTVDAGWAGIFAHMGKENVMPDRFAPATHGVIKRHATFEQYMAAVDSFMVGECGLTHRDIDDWTWRDSYDSGESPESAARDAMINAGYPEDAFDEDNGYDDAFFS